MRTAMCWVWVMVACTGGEPKQGDTYDTGAVGSSDTTTTDDTDVEDEDGEVELRQATMCTDVQDVKACPAADSVFQDRIGGEVCAGGLLGILASVKELSSSREGYKGGTGADIPADDSWVCCYEVMVEPTGDCLY